MSNVNEIITKSVTDLPLAESSEGLNLIVNDGGAAKQIPASEVGAQADWTMEDESNPGFIKNKPEIPAAQVQSDWNEVDNSKPEFIKNKPEIPAAQVQSDWNETDNTSPAFIKNKPVEEWDLDIVIKQRIDADGNQEDPTYEIKTINTFENIKNKVLNGVKVSCKCQVKLYKITEDAIMAIENFHSMKCGWGINEEEDGAEMIIFSDFGQMFSPFVVLASDNTIVFVTPYN